MDSDLSSLEQLNHKRRAIRLLLSSSDPADALTSYYALWHDPRRTYLHVHYNAAHKADGFITVSQTGADLFRPLVTLRASSRAVAAELLHTALTPRRPYRIIVPVKLASVIRDHLVLQKSALNRIYTLDAARFQPVINVLVQRITAPQGGIRFQIESQGRVAALSGTNWRSPSFGEVFVYVHPESRGRGWGKSVASACTTALLEERVRPLYTVEEDNEASIHIAADLGYSDTNLREFAAEGQLR